MEFNAHDVETWECKAIGLPRTSEEVFAVRNLGIDHNLVREWILTLEALEEYKSKSNKKEKIIIKDKWEKEAVETEEKAEPAEEVSANEIVWSLAELNSLYQAKFGKKVPWMLQKNAEWISKKLNS